MDSLIKDVLFQKLRGKHWKIGADLGCGFGDAGPLFKAHVDFLLGVERNIPSLFRSRMRRCYDLLVKGSLLDFKTSVSVIFLMDVIEHLPKKIGLTLLNKLNSEVFLSTALHWNPCYSFYILWSPHRSLWTVRELEQNGFEVEVLTSPRRQMFDTIFAHRL